MSEDIFPEDIIDAAAEICRNLGMATTATNCMPIVKGLLAERQRDRWQDMSTAPEKGPFLAYGYYLYPGDKDVTEYTSIVERSDDPAWPWATSEGNAAKEAFTHWQPLPAAPKGKA